ncbi:uncharacterized protein ABDE67_018988 [Symphorus nematophorus]
MPGPSQHFGTRQGPSGGNWRNKKNSSKQYVKLIYNTTEPDKVSIEYGVLKCSWCHSWAQPPYWKTSKTFKRPLAAQHVQHGPARRNPGVKGFSRIFKVDNVTFQNETDVALKEGENIFMMPKFGGRGHHHMHRGRGHHHHMQYVKLIYNATEPINPGEMVGMEDDPEEDYY